MKKLFENVEGNRFRLLTESISEPKSGLVREGLKKVFSSAGNEISYGNVQNIGLGYIKDVNEARKCALDEAREIASEFGFKDDMNRSKFIREDLGSNPETNVSAPEENREIQIGKKIIQYAQLLKKYMGKEEEGSGKWASANAIEKYAEELIQMHGAK